MFFVYLLGLMRSYLLCKSIYPGSYIASVVFTVPGEINRLQFHCQNISVLYGTLTIVLVSTLTKLRAFPEHHLANLFSKGPGSKYFRVWGPYKSLFHIMTYFSLPSFEHIKLILWLSGGVKKKHAAASCSLLALPIEEGDCISFCHSVACLTLRRMLIKMGKSLIMNIRLSHNICILHLWQ